MSTPNLQNSVIPPQPVPSGTDARLLRPWLESLRNTVAQCVQVVNSMRIPYSPRAVIGGTGGAADPAPADPGTYITIGSAAEGNEAAETTTWNAGSDGVGGDKKGCWFYAQSRSAYYHAGDKKVYGYTRKIKLDQFGRIYEIGAETRFEIDVPVT